MGAVLTRLTHPPVSEKSGVIISTVNSFCLPKQGIGSIALTFSSFQAYRWGCQSPSDRSNSETDSIIIEFGTSVALVSDTISKQSVRSVSATIAPNGNLSPSMDRLNAVEMGDQAFSLLAKGTFGGVDGQHPSVFCRPSPRLVKFETVCDQRCPRLPQTDSFDCQCLNSLLICS